MKTVSGSAQNYANFLLDVGQINAWKAATMGFSLSKFKIYSGSMHNCRLNWN